MTALAALKAHLNLDMSEDDALLTSKLASAEDLITVYINDADVPTTYDTARPMIREAILQLAAYWYGQREVVSELSMREVPYGVQTLLAPFQRWEF